MLANPRATALWPLLLQLLLLTLVIADVSHLSKEYLPPDGRQTTSKQPLADEPAHVEHMQVNDGAYFTTAGLMLPPGYAIPTGGNVAAPPMSPPNFPLPIYPPFFGFNGGSEGFGGAQVPPQFAGATFPVAAQFSAGPQSGPFPVGPQAGQFSAAIQNGNFPAGPQGGAFSVEPFPSGPQSGPLPTGLQNGPFPTGPQSGPFPAGPQNGQFLGGPQSSQFPSVPQGAAFPAIPQAGGGFPVGPTPQNPFGPDYLTTQGLPAAGMQLPFGVPPGFAGIGAAYPYQPFSPSFGVPAQHYQPHQQPQPFADEPEPEAKPKSSDSATKTTIAPKINKSNRDTVYASNGGYIYQRAK